MKLSFAVCMSPERGANHMTLQVNGRETVGQVYLSGLVTYDLWLLTACYLTANSDNLRYRCERNEHHAYYATLLAFPAHMNGVFTCYQ